MMFSFRASMLLVHQQEMYLLCVNTYSDNSQNVILKAWPKLESLHQNWLVKRKFRVHRVFEMSLKVLEFWKKNPGPWKSLKSPCISMFQQYLSVVHTVQNKTWQKRAVMRFFSGLNLTLYFSFWWLCPQKPPDPTGALPLDPAGGLGRPPDFGTWKLQF